MLKLCQFSPGQELTGMYHRSKISTWALNDEHISICQYNHDIPQSGDQKSEEKKLL